MQTPDYRSKFQQGKLFDRILSLGEDIDHHHEQANSDCDRKVGDRVIALCVFKCVEDDVNEVGNQNCNDYDENCGEALLDRDQFVACILRVLAQLRQYWQNHCQLQVLVVDEPVRDEDAEKRQFIDQHYIQFLASVPVRRTIQVVLISCEKEAQTDAAVDDHDRCRDQTPRFLISQQQQVEYVTGVEERNGIEDSRAVVANLLGRRHFVRSVHTLAIDVRAQLAFVGYHFLESFNCFRQYTLASMKEHS